jgi:hypothetical protein
VYDLYQLNLSFCLKWLDFILQVQYLLMKLMPCAVLEVTLPSMKLAEGIIKDINLE